MEGIGDENTHNNTSFRFAPIPRSRTNGNPDPKVFELIATVAPFVADPLLHLSVGADPKESPRAIDSLFLVVTERCALRVEDVFP